MERLEQRSNIIHRNLHGSSVLIYEDHRSFLFVLWHAIHTAKVADSPVTLLFFDRHTDARLPTPSALKIIEGFRTNPASMDERKFHSFVEWDLGANDDDWLLAGIEAGLIGDVILVGCNEETMTSQLNLSETIHKDHTGEEHYIWRIDHLWTALEKKGALFDQYFSKNIDRLWNKIGWSPSGLFSNPPQNVVLDFDLDCFAGEMPSIPKHTFPWPSHVIEYLFTNPSSHIKTKFCKDYCALDFVRTIFDHARFTTIAKESPYCGGTQPSEQILGTLDRLLWDGQLTNEIALSWL